MKTVKFTEIGMKNFKGYKGQISLPIYDNKLVLIMGKNGIGKTTLFDSIPFTWYGATPEASGDECVNREIGKNCKTWTKFILAPENINYTIERYQKYDKMGNTVILLKENEKIKVGQRDVIAEIERLLVPKNLFFNTFYFAQQVKTFFTNLPDSNKKEIFRTILKLEKYVEYQKKANKFLKELEDLIKDLEIQKRIKLELINQYENDIMSFNRNIRDIVIRREKEIENINHKISELNIKKETIKDDIKKLEHEIESFNDLSGNINLTENKIRKIEEKIRTVFLKIENEKNIKINDANKEYYKLKEDVEEVKEYKLLECQKQYDLFIEHLSEKNKEIDIAISKNLLNSQEVNIFIKNLENKIKEITERIIKTDVPQCPTCESLLDKKAKDVLEKKVQKYQTEKDLLCTELEVLKAERLDLEEKKTKLRKIEDVNRKKFIEEKDKINVQNKNDIKGIKEALDNKLNLISDLMLREKENLTREFLSDLKTNRFLLSELNEKQEVLNRKKEMLPYCKLDLVKIDSTIENTEKELENLKDSKVYEDYNFKIIEIKEKILIEKGSIENIDLLMLKNIKKKDIIDFWSTGFSSQGIQSLLIDESIPFMNRNVKRYLDEISNGRYKVSFDTLSETKDKEKLKDKISVNVFDNVTKANSVSMLSGGQKRLIDLATILTLSDLQSNIYGIDFNILLFDEIFDSLDEENTESVSFLLKEKSKEKSIYIISHMHNEKIEYDELIKL